MKGRTANDDAARRHATLCLWIANVSAGALVGTAYLEHVPEETTLRTSVFAVLGLVSSVATLALVPGLLFYCLLRFVERAWLQGLLQAALGASFLVLLKADTLVYDLLGYHFNGAVWNVMLTRGSEDAVHLGGKVWWLVSTVVVLLAGAQYFLWRFLYRRALARRAAPRGRSSLSRPAALCAGSFLAVLSIEKTIYAAADLEGDRAVHDVSQMLPMYQGLRVSELLPGGLESARHALPRVDFRRRAAPLAYPRAWPTVDPGGPRPNVLVLVLDSWRRDMLDPDVTPRLWSFAAGARRFEDHWSGGNGTRFGVFAMLYGLHGWYWFPVLEERRAPVLMDVLGELGYERAVFSSASQSFPEFRETAWVDVLDHVFDDYPSRVSHERDSLAAERFEGWVAGRQARARAEPFFVFALLDAPHQPYFAPDGGPFQPAAEELDYIELARSNAPDLVERVFNRYRNAVHHADRVAGGMIDALRAAGELENTIVIVTGDHGEEFQEHGFWGHTSNFSEAQLAVPLYVKGPGIEPGVERRRTSHLDLPCTVLELLGADPAARPGWTQGENLFSPPAQRVLTVAGWEHLGLLVGDDVFRVKMDSNSPLDVDVFDASWRPRLDQAGPYLRQRASLEQLAAECRVFLAP